MSTEQTAQQLELAAQLIRTGHPWKSSPQAPDTDIYSALRDGFEIRLALATPPDNRPLHNPDNLTAEQVGVGYRLIVEGEPPHKDAQLWITRERKWAERLCSDVRSPYGNANTYRLPLSVPWPEPAFQLPPCAPGMRWHREDAWKADDLPSGYRPLVYDETELPVDEFCRPGDDEWVSSSRLSVFVKAKGHFNKLRTTRPLTFEHAGKTWTYHRPGDPMPCDGEAWVECLCDHGGALDVARAKVWSWNGNAIGWRYADEKKTVPLGPEDVPPGSVVCCDTDHWFQVLYASPIGVCINNVGLPVQYRWTELVERWQINRSIPLTGKWNPDAWEPCSKEIPAQTLKQNG